MSPQAQLKHTPSQSPLLGQMLVSAKLISEHHLRYALDTQKASREKLGKILVRSGLLTEKNLSRVLARQIEIPFLNIDQLDPDPGLVRKFSTKRCLTLKMCPIKEDKNKILTATSEIPSPRQEQEVLRVTGKRPSFSLAAEGALTFAIHKAFSHVDVPIETALERETSFLISDVQESCSPEAFLQNLLHFAIIKRATDIHIRPLPLSIDIAFRIDGTLAHMLSLPPQLQRIVSSLKLKASMDISEQRLPQDGRFSVSILSQEFDIRVSSIVSAYGEDLVLRILPKARADFTLHSLGFLEEDIDVIQSLFELPSGIALVTGPTGSGKSTTMIAGLMSLDLLMKNIVTVEDPIEYLVPLARQTQVNPDIGYDFRHAMYHFLRHDPDVILIGELRDDKTASAAMTAALTGHLVLSTLHSDSVIGSITRLQSLNVDNLIIAEALNVVLSQRLIRCVCPHCKELYPPTPKEIDYIGQNVAALSRGRGCTKCNHTGYFGRTLIYGILELEQELVMMLKENAPIRSIEKKAREKRKRSMFGVGVDKIMKHVTTVEELQRTLGKAEN